MRFHKTIFIIALVLIVGTIVLKGLYIGHALQSDKKIYQIEVDSFNGTESYIATEYVVDQKTNCITFKDAMGMRRTVCNKYTLTEY
jgi:hypothetical protein